MITAGAANGNGMVKKSIGRELFAQYVLAGSV
jgi:hypothetical protein